MDGKKTGTWTMIAIALIVLLRVGIGGHFLFEGLWKMDPANKFSAKGFLGMAKGPTKDLYYRMLPDLDGSGRLQLAEVVETKEKDGQRVAGASHGWTLPVFEAEWYSYYNAFLKKYPLSDEQKAKTDAIFQQYIGSLRECAAQQRDAIREFLGSRERFAKRSAIVTNGTEHQKMRDWDMQMSLRNEGARMADVPEKMGDNMQLALWEELTGSQKTEGKLPTIAYGENKVPGAGIVSQIPYIKEFAKPSRLGILDLTVTLGLSAIGVCLILGFCTRLAALAGTAFMLNVTLSQFPWPTVYPYAPDIVGHSMIFNKDSVEMIALLVLAVLPAGRWGGLDWFLWHGAGKHIMRLYGCKKDPLTPELHHG